jgi:hypothetical protein
MANYECSPFSFAVPEGWSDHSVIVLLSPESPPRTIVASREDAKENPGDWFKRNRSELATVLPGMTWTRSDAGPQTTRPRFDGKREIVGRGETHHCFVRVAGADGSVWTVTGTAGSAFGESLPEAVEAFVGSLEKGDGERSLGTAKYALPNAWSEVRTVDLRAPGPGHGRLTIQVGTPPGVPSGRDAVLAELEANGFNFEHSEATTENEWLRWRSKGGLRQLAAAQKSKLSAGGVGLRGGGPAKPVASSKLALSQPKTQYLDCAYREVANGPITITLSVSAESQLGSIVDQAMP